MADALKEKAVSFLQLAAKGDVPSAFQKYVGKGFRHHNAFFRGDAESLRKAMEENASYYPDKIFDVKQVMAEGDRVMLYSHVKQNKEELGKAIVHIFRFQNGQIVEMWDIGQQIPENSPNENGMF